MDRQYTFTSHSQALYAHVLCVYVGSAYGQIVTYMYISLQKCISSLTIGQEMEIWETSGMWPFSCFGYMKGLKSLPGK